jgi:hypothetical protein
MGNYYSLVAGLPDLLPDDPKLRFSLSDFKTELEENLSEKDLQVIGCFFMKYDNENLIRLYHNPDATIVNPGNLVATDLLEIIQLFKEMDKPKDKRIPPYFHHFLPALIAEKPLAETLSWEDQLTSVYYDFAIGVKNKFIASWFAMNLNLINLLTAINCRKYNLNIETSIIGQNDISEAIRTSHAKDFGLLPIFPEVDEILRIADEDDLFERERKIDLFKWNWLEEHGFFHYFDVERLFIYLLKTDILQRWTQLDKVSGKMKFRDLIVKMQHAFEFPAEFKIVKIK